MQMQKGEGLVEGAILFFTINKGKTNCENTLLV